MNFIKKALLSLALISSIALGVTATTAHAQSVNNSVLQVVTSPEFGGDMKWVLTVKGGKVFPQDFNGGKVTVLRLEGDPIILRNMWAYDPNDNVWVWEQYIPENVIGLMIDTPTQIDYEFLQKPAYWRKWWWGNSIFRDLYF